MQAQIMETFASSEDQTAASAFVLVRSRPLTIVLSSYRRVELVAITLGELDYVDMIKE